MSEWRVFVDKIEIFPHPNAEKMCLGKVGTFQVVIGKGLYKTGDTVVFAPKRSILASETPGTTFVIPTRERVILKGRTQTG